MEYEKRRDWCHVRSAIYRSSKGVRYWKNHPVPLDDRISDEDKKADDWMEYDPRETDDCSLFAFND